MDGAADTVLHLVRGTGKSCEVYRGVPTGKEESGGFMTERGGAEEDGAVRGEDTDIGTGKAPEALREPQYTDDPP